MNAIDLQKLMRWYHFTCGDGLTDKVLAHEAAHIVKHHEPLNLWRSNMAATNGRLRHWYHLRRTQTQPQTPSATFKSVRNAIDS